MKRKKTGTCYMYMQATFNNKLEGVIACRLFAIAFAVHSALGDIVPDLCFDQSKMRTHLTKCFRIKKMLPFPMLEQRRKSSYNSFFPGRGIELFCKCHMPESYDDMVECSSYDTWYHIKCVNLIEIPEVWHCPDCSLTLTDN